MWILVLRHMEDNKLSKNARIRFCFGKFLKYRLIISFLCLIFVVSSGYTIFIELFINKMLLKYKSIVLFWKIFEK